jgi:PAS domain S-box-containing protein
MSDRRQWPRQVLLSRILDVAADAIIAIDGNQTILLFNQSAERTFGYCAEEVLGRPLDLLLPPDAAANHPGNVRQFASADIASRPMTERLSALACRKDGSQFPVEINISKLTNQGQAILVAVVRDITSRRRAEQALSDSEERYRSIVAAISEGIVMQDAQGRIITCNQSAERILGLSHDQMMGLTSFDPRWQAVHEDGSPTTGDDHPIVITRLTGQPQSNVVLGVHRPDGTLVWMSVNTQPLRRPGESLPYAVVASFADITDQKRAELALRESEARYRALFENSIDGVLFTAPDGSIFAANPEACRMLGRTEEEICTVGRAGVVDPSDPRLPVVLDERLRTGRFRNELTLVRKDGTRFPAEVSSGVFADKDGNLRTSMVVRDITERKHAYELLEQRVTERTRELEALLVVSRNVAAMLELKPLLDVILTQLRTVLDFSGAAIAILEDGRLEMLDYHGVGPREKMLQASVPLDRDSGYQQVVRRREPVIIADIWADTPWMAAVRKAWDDETLSLVAHTHSWLGVPLISGGELIGVLRVDHIEPDHFTEEHARLAKAFADQAAVAIQNARLYEQTQRVVALEERQRLARELHDSVSQALYGIVLGTKTARALLDSSPAKAVEPLEYALSLAESAFTELRALIYELRPESLEAEGLTAALTKQTDLLRARRGINVRAELCAEPDLPLDRKEAFYRIAQEALNNVAKYAHAQNVMLRLTQSADLVMLEVDDDGMGFDVMAPTPGHLGLSTMQERAERVRGTFRIESTRGKGTHIEVRIPIGPAGAS